MKFLIFAFTLTLTLKAYSLSGQDDRFYIHDTHWGKLLNGIIKVHTCSGFVIEGDIVVTSAHCFKKDTLAHLNKEGFKLFNEDLKINDEAIKNVSIAFGDANFDKHNENLQFDKRSSFYGIKDIYLGYLTHSCESSTVEERITHDYALIKLNKEIPKEIKRFKIFKEELLEDYEILDISKNKNEISSKEHYSVSTAGYHGDNLKTASQRLAHLSCQIKNTRQHKGNWIDYTNCDITKGASGSPLFYILRHKKTKEIELAALSIASSIKKSKLRIFHEKTQKYTMAQNDKYYFSAFNLNKASAFTRINNNETFLKNLNEFKKDSSVFKDKSVYSLEKDPFLDFNWFEDFVHRSTNKEFKKKKKIHEFDIIFKQSCSSTLIKHIRSLDLSSEKSILFYKHIESKLKNYYPYSKRMKKFSYRKIASLKEKDLALIFEDETYDKLKAHKLWEAFFWN